MRKPAHASQKIAILKKVPFFKGLSASDLESISRRFSERHFKKGQYLCWEGDPADYLHVVRQGKVKITKSSASGREIVLEIVSSGEICGASAIFNSTQLASAQAVEHVSVYSLSRRDFLTLLGQHRALAVHLISYLGEKLMKAHEMMLSLMTSKVEKRIAALLTGLCQKHGSVVPQGIRIDLRLRRQDIADIVGATVETAIRVMSRFTKQGMLVTEGKHIIIIDRKKLQGMVSG